MFREREIKYYFWEKIKRISGMVFYFRDWSSWLGCFYRLRCTILIPNIHLLMRLSLDNLQCLFNLTTLALNSLFIIFKVPASTFRFDIILLSLVAHPFRLSLTLVRSANVNLISSWPVVKLLVFAFNSLRSPLSHSFQRGEIILRYGWESVVSMSLA